MNLRVMGATLHKNLVTQLRAYPISFALGSLLSGFYTALGAWLCYRVLFRGALSEAYLAHAGTQDYMSYVIVGSVVYLFLQRTCLNVSRSLITELRTGTLESLMLAPFRRAEYFVGNMLVQTVVTLLEAAVSIAIGLCFGLRFGPVHLPTLLVVVAAGLLAFFGLSLLVGGAMLGTRDTYITQNTLFAAMLLLCGISYPAEFLPLPLQWLGGLIPLTSVARLVRGTVLGGKTFGMMLPDFGWALLLGGMYTAIGFALLPRIERRALEGMEG